MWGTTFTVQAIISTGFSEEFGHFLKKAHQYVKDSQGSFRSKKHFIVLTVLVARKYRTQAVLICSCTFRSLTTAPVTLVTGTDTFLRVHGHSPLLITDGPFQRLAPYCIYLQCNNHLLQLFNKILGRTSKY